VTPELIAYIYQLGGYAAVVEAALLVWVTTQWLRAVADKQKWQEGCKTCLTTLLQQAMDQTQKQVAVTQQNTDAIQKLAQDLSVAQKLMGMLEIWVKPKRSQG
jgi:formate dehydrogenase assembly factor FdhD